MFLSCYIGFFTKTPCGTSVHYPKELRTTLEQCNRDISSHLSSLKLGIGQNHIDSDVPSEGHLISRRAGVFAYNSCFSICPKHRYDLGIYWRPKQTCQYPGHLGKAKPTRSINSLMSFAIWTTKMCLVPVGSGVCIKQYDFSESQNGKSYCDAKIAHLRSKIRQYVCAGNDVKSASEMKTAIDSVGGVTGCRAAYVEIDHKLAEETSKRKTSTWKGISKISNIEIRENEVISWKAFQIGNGNHHTEEDLRKISPAPPPCALIILDDFIIPTSEEGNIHSHKEQEASDVVQCEELSSEALFEPQFNINSDTFSCVEEGCVKVFQSYAKLEAHILCGNHRYSNRIVSSMDQVKMNWKESCISIVEHSIVSKSQQLQEGETSSEMGWALKKDRKSVRFNEKVKDYLRGIFSAGDNSGNKANPFDVSRNMRVYRDETGNKMFSPDQYLQPSQIASFFSRLSVQSRNPKPSKIDDEDLGSAIQLLEAIEAMDMMDTSEQN